LLSGNPDPMANQKHHRLIEPELSPMGKENASMKLAITVQENGRLHNSSHDMNFSTYDHQTDQIQKTGLIDRKEVSIVIPLFNEEESVGRLNETLMPVLENMGKTYEVICIDDGSTDGTYPVGKRIEYSPYPFAPKFWADRGFLCRF
jgi:hypothetical protein